MIFKTIKSHNRWIKEISKYVGNQSDEDIIKLSLAYTLQSLRKGEDIKRFNWGDKEC